MSKKYKTLETPLNNDPNIGILFSMAYLLLEVRTQNMPKTAAGLETVIDLFFEDMEHSPRSNDNYAQLHSVLKKMMSMKEKEISFFLKYIVKIRGERIS